MTKYRYGNRYDHTDARSIYSYAQGLEGKTLNEISDESVVEFKGKGNFGQLLERYGFGYEINSDAHADFSEVGMELKACPLTVKKKKDLSLIREIDLMKLKVKERLVLCMFDFSTYHVDLKSSHLWEKVSNILMVFYRYQTNLKGSDLRIALVFRYILDNRPNDYLIIKQDYNKITDLVDKGFAHELSEGLTNYLGVCRKGQGGTKENAQPQPNSDILAKRRAFCLKISYMSQLWEEIAMKRKHRDIFTRVELEKESLDEVLLARLKLYNGMKMSQLKKNFSVSTKSKAWFRQVIDKVILQNYEEESNEIKKAGIMIKVVRINKDTYKPYESMSFPNIRYDDLAKEEHWEDSHLYSLLSARFLFVVIGQNQKKDDDAFVLDSFLWNLPAKDEALAEDFWLDCRDKVRHGDLNHFWKIADKKRFHVRPKAQKASDLTYNTPTGEGWKKYSYWMNAQYIHEIMSEYFNENFKEPI